MSRVKTFLCGQCQTPSDVDLDALPPHFPFCSMRCKTLNLGDWLSDEDEDGDEDGDEDDGDEAEDEDAG